MKAPGKPSEKSMEMLMKVCEAIDIDPQRILADGLTISSVSEETFMVKAEIFGYISFEQMNDILKEVHSGDE